MMLTIYNGKAIYRYYNCIGKSFFPNLHDTLIDLYADKFSNQRKPLS